MTSLKLFHGEGSNCCQRVKWILAYKGIAHETVDIAPFTAAQMRDLAPLASVPCLEVGDVMITESMAIAEYLEEAFPQVALLPQQSLARAEVRVLCEAANAYVHPGQRNRLAMFFLPQADAAEIKELRCNWLNKSLAEVERMLRGVGPFACGVEFTLADIFLVPLYIKYLGFGGEPELLPKLDGIRRACAANPRVAAAAPADLKL